MTDNGLSISLCHYNHGPRCGEDLWGCEARKKLQLTGDLAVDRKLREEKGEKNGCVVGLFLCTLMRYTGFMSVLFSA